MNIHSINFRNTKLNSNKQLNKKTTKCFAKLSPNKQLSTFNNKGKIDIYTPQKLDESYLEIIMIAEED